MNFNPYSTPQSALVDSAPKRPRSGVIASLVLVSFFSVIISAAGGFIAGFIAGCIYRIVHPNPYEPMVIWASQYGGWSALAHGVVGLLCSVFLYAFANHQRAERVVIVLYTLIGSCVGVTIGIAETIVPRVYLAKQFFEAPFAAGLSGLILSVVIVLAMKQVTRRVLSQAVAIRTKIAFLLVGTTLSLCLVASILAPLLADVDFIISTMLRFLSIVLIVLLTVLTIYYRRFSKQSSVSETEEPQVAG